MTASSNLARFAAEEFTRRRAALAKAHTERQRTADQCNRNAQLWLAIAAAAGADLPELAIERIFPPGTKGRMRADDIADPKAYRAELARARDVAVRRSLSNPKDLIAQQRAWDLQALAVHLGCREITMIKEERNAA